MNRTDIAALILDRLEAEGAPYAFQGSRAVEVVARITGLTALEPDADRYAGGIGLMSRVPA